MKRTKSYPIFVVLAVLVLASLACSLLSGPANNGGKTGNVTDNVDQDEPAEVPETSPDAPDDGETSSLSTVKTGLDALDSYSMVYSFQIDGKDSDGNPQVGSLEIAEEIDRPNNKQHTRYSTSGSAFGDIGSFGNFDIYIIDNMTYMYGASNGEAPSCMGFSDDSETADMSSFDMDSMLGDVEDAKLVKKNETVNELQANHYQFDQTNLFFGAFTSANGEYWSTADGLIVRYSGEAVGKYSPMGSEIDGKVSWKYNLNQVNQSVDITLPAECEGQMPSTDIPIPANATEQSSFSGIITFNSPDSPEIVGDYYRSELASQGWTAGDDSSMESLIMFAYTKDNRKLDVMITEADGGGSTVMLTETK